MAGDGHQGVTRDRHQHGLSAASVQDHDRVGALADVSDTTRAKTLVLFLGQAATTVAANQKKVGAWLVRSPIVGGNIDSIDPTPRHDWYDEQEHQPQGQGHADHWQQPDSTLLGCAWLRLTLRLLCGLGPFGWFGFLA